MSFMKKFLLALLGAVLIPSLADTATQTASPVTITWTQSSDTGVVGYKVYQYFPNETVPTITTVTCNCLTTGPLNMKTTYTFNVSTLTSTDESVLSPDLNFTTGTSSIVPKPPTNITLK